MKKLTCFFLAFILLITGCTPAKSVTVPVPEPAYWPTSDWKSSTPEAQGMDSTFLAKMVENISAAQTNIYSMLIVRNGYLVTEIYNHPYTHDTKVHIQSITKSVIGMLVGSAIGSAAIKSKDETVLSYFPGVSIANLSKDKEGIRLSHLLSMSSGLDCQEFSSAGPKMEQSSDWARFMLELKMVAAPGKKFGYCNGNAHLLSAVVAKTTGMSTREYANQKLFQPLGIPTVEAADWGSDPQGYATGGYGLHLRPVDLAKLALLNLQGGKWDGQQILPTSWVTESTTQQIVKEDGSGYGYLWTVYPQSGHYAALGLGGQQIHVYPSKNLIVIVTAGLKAYAEAPEIEKLLAEYILPAVKSEQPLPENPAGLAQLQSLVAAAANPVKPVADLPGTALDISGKTYSFAENPLGWQKATLVFKPGAAVAQLYLNDFSPIEVGLDHLYRLTKVEPLGELLLRGRWEDAQTFVGDYPYSFGGPTRLGELGETQVRFNFSADQLEVKIVPLIFGGDALILTGSR